MSNVPNTRLLTPIILCVLLSVAVRGAIGADRQPDVRLQVLDYSGIQRLIESHRGKVVVMDCWATYCAPCIEEFPNLVALNEKYGPDRVACISLSFDFEGPGKPDDVQETVLAFLKRNDARFDNVLSSDPADELYKKMELASIPAVYVYGRDGALVEQFTGSKPYDRVIPLVERLISGP